MLLLLCGDIESNPGPKTYIICPQCNEQVHVKQEKCNCGYVMNKKKGRPAGTTVEAGYNVSIGCRIGTTKEAGYNVPSGRTVGSTMQAGFQASSGQAVGTTKAKGYIVSTGRRTGTSKNAGYGVSCGRPVVCDSKVLDINTSQCVRGLDKVKSWPTDVNCLSLNDELLSLADKRIAQQIRFDSKPLAIGMCYCCGSILWSRVDNSHTNLVDINLTEEQIPAVAYQEALLTAGKGLLEYRHKSGKLYACAVCKTFKFPSDYKFHVGYLEDKLPIQEWDMTFPEVILNLKNPIEQCQVALCGFFSTTVKDAKRHQWRHIQDEVNSLHKLDRHYYGLFSFLMINEDLSDKLVKNSEAYERIRLALHWLKKNNHLYQDFLARFETLYRYVRQEIVNPEVLKLDQNKILEYEALGLAFPVDSEYFEQYSPL